MPIACLRFVMVRACGNGNISSLSQLEITEAALKWCSYKKVFWKYAANLQENTNAEVWVQ